MCVNLFRKSDHLIPFNSRAQLFSLECAVIYVSVHKNVQTRDGFKTKEANLPFTIQENLLFNK